MLQGNRPSCLPSKHEKMEQGGVVEETLKIYQINPFKRHE